MISFVKTYFAADLDFNLFGRPVSFRMNTNCKTRHRKMVWFRHKSKYGFGVAVNPDEVLL